LTNTGRAINKEVNKLDFLKNFLGQFQTFSNLDLGDAEGKVRDFLSGILQAEKELLSLRLSNLENFNKKYVEKFSALQKSLSIGEETDFKKKIIDLEFQIKVLGIDPNDPNGGRLRELFKLQAEEQLKAVEIEASDLRIKIGASAISVDPEYERQIENATKLIRASGVTGRDDRKTLDIPLPSNIFEDRIGVYVDKINEIKTLLGQPIGGVEFWKSQAPSQDNFETVAEYQESVLNFLKSTQKSGVDAFAEIKKAVDQFNEQLAQVLATGVAEFFGDVFDKAKEGTLTWETLSDSLQDFIFDITKAVAKLVIMNAILKALKISTPAGGAAGGAGLLGILFPKLFGGARPFATGGIVTGPTFGMIGEAGTEAVLPLSYLNNLLSTSGGGQTLSARVSGSDLLFLVEKAGTQKNRYF
jgi:hypothetical protein